MQTMRIEVNEMPKAFRVNGVTLAKRHLANTCGNGCNGDTQKMLFKYLTIVPFLAEAFQIPEKASPSVRYGALKARRVYKALGLREDNPHAVVAFMLFCLEQTGELPAINDLNKLGPAIARAFGARNEDVKPPSFQEGDRSNVISFAQARQNRTLH